MSDNMLRICGDFDDVEVRSVDAEGGFVVDILRDDQVLRIWYTPAHYSAGSWTTRPKFVDETIRVKVL